MKYFKYILLGVMVSFSSCNKYLEVKPKGVILPEKLSDYEGLLTSHQLTETFPSHMMYLTDDVQGEFTITDRGSSANAYYWRPQLELNSELSPPVWGLLYSAIYYTNIILNYVDETNDGSEEQKKKIFGEAMIIKADCYFNLLTVYAKAYNASTASSDPGLPLINSTDVTDKTPQRSSVEETIAEIISLLKQAADNLPATNISRVRANKYAAYALLARVYLYMHDYNSASLYAEKALESDHELLDYNNYDRESLLPAEQSPETIWMRLSEDYGVPGFMIYSDDLLQYLNDDDLRLAHFRRDPLPITRIYARGNAGFGPTYPEMYLTKAEALALAGNANDAIDIVNMIRKKRIKTDAYVDLHANNSEEALEIVMAERRREMAFLGQRWMDMKRLDAENRMPDVIRKNLETSEVEATLKAGSSTYTFEIPVRVLLFNPEMTKNH